MQRVDKKTGKEKSINIDISRLEKSIRRYEQVNDELVQLGGAGNSWLSTSNIVGEWAEILVCNSLKLTQEIAANKDIDAIDAKTKKNVSNKK